MKTGTILLIPFPFAEHTGAKKVRPSVVVCETADVHHDLVVCAISSKVPAQLNAHEMRLLPDADNRLRTASVLKIDRIVTVKSKDVIARLGNLSEADELTFKIRFRNLV